MRFLCDENITKGVVQLLKNSGQDVESVQSLKLTSIKNSILLTKAIQMKRILVTFDRDFLSISIKPEKFPGILVIKIIPNRDKYVLPSVQYLLDNLSLLDFNSKIIILEKNSIKFSQ
ncbi:MAG: DUF5615 family PIN-like protein [Candidatus Kariarchaeaceae archaeon]